jgi:cytochrome c-type biogenesis protein CcmH
MTRPGRAGWLIALVFWLAGVAMPAAANEALPLADDPVVEQRLIRISEDIRCLVCQNESLAGSRADLANDLRREIRKLIREGKTDAEITDFLVSRYGDFVLYRPPVKPLTWALWFGPFLLLLGGIGFLIRFVWQRQRAHAAAAEPALSDDERQRAKALLDATDS